MLLVITLWSPCSSGGGVQSFLSDVASDLWKHVLMMGNVVVNVMLALEIFPLLLFSSCMLSCAVSLKAEGNPDSVLSRLGELLLLLLILTYSLFHQIGIPREAYVDGLYLLNMVQFLIRAKKNIFNK